jgi:LysM repeat protein
VYELNPAFHRWATDPTGPNFLLLPVDAAPVFMQNIGQLTEEQRLGATHYTVRRGDSVVSIAKHFNTTVNVVRELNDVPTGRLTVGTDLRLPSPDIQLPPKVMLAAARVDGRGRAARRPHMHVVSVGDCASPRHERQYACDDERHAPGRYVAGRAADQVVRVLVARIRLDRLGGTPHRVHGADRGHPHSNRQAVSGDGVADPGLEWHEHPHADPGRTKADDPSGQPAELIQS